MSEQETTRTVEIRGNWSPFDPETGRPINRLILWRELVEALGLDDTQETRRIMTITVRRSTSSSAGGIPWRSETPTVDTIKRMGGRVLKAGSEGTLMNRSPQDSAPASSDDAVDNPTMTEEDYRERLRGFGNDQFMRELHQDPPPHLIRLACARCHEHDQFGGRTFEETIGAARRQGWYVVVRGDLTEDDRSFCLCPFHAARRETQEVADDGR